MKEQYDYFLLRDEQINIDLIENKFTEEKTNNVVQCIPAYMAFQVCFFLNWTEFNSFALVDKRCFVGCADFSKTATAIKYFSQDFDTVKSAAYNLFDLIIKKYSHIGHFALILDEVINNAISPARRRSMASYLVADQEDEIYITDLQACHCGCCVFCGVGCFVSGLILMVDASPTKIIVFTALGILTTLQCFMLLCSCFGKDFCNVGQYLRKLARDDKAQIIINRMRKAEGDDKELLNNFNRSVSDLITLTCIKHKRLSPLWEKVYQEIRYSN